MRVNPGEEPPNMREINWLSEVLKAWEGKYYERDVVYQFSNGRQFKSTDGTDSGIYGGAE